VAIQEFFIDKTGDNNDQLREPEILRLQQNARRKLVTMKQYAFARYCRRRNILNYFGQNAEISGCHCDACRGKIKRAPERVSRDHGLGSYSKQKRIKLRVPNQEVLPPLDPATQRRFESLREARRRLAHQDSLPAFCVMHDRTLLEVAREAPASKSALLEIFGVGAKTVEKYGDALLAAIRSGGPGK